MTLAAVVQPDNCPTCGQAVTAVLDIKYDHAARVLIAGGRAVCLAKTAHGVMSMLLSRFGQCVETDDLIGAAYGLDEPSNARKSVAVIIFNLRFKLVGTGLDVVTHRGVGYAIVHATPADGKQQSEDNRP